MTATAKQNDNEMVVQEHCIDLPGESVQCWLGGGTDKLRIILRKHRDVIFDIHIGGGKTYTLETTESDFYNARDKKIVYAARHSKVTFIDGERMHVWVSRGFRGALLVKYDGHVISKVEPNEWDKHRHGDDPKEKPAPIIITVGNPRLDAQPTTPRLSAVPPSAPQQPQHEEQVVHVHEASKEGAPPAVLTFFMDGGESLQLDKEDIVTRNWITAQVAAFLGYTKDNFRWIKELAKCKFYLKKVMHKSGPKVYIIFNGFAGLRELMSAPKYSLSNPKIIRITGGAGGIKQGWDAAKGAAKDALKVAAKEEGKLVVKGGGIAVVFAIGMDVAEWYKDYSEIGSNGKPKRDLFDLLAKIGTDLVKAGLIAAATTVAVAVVLSIATAIGATVALPVIGIAVGTFALSVALTFLVEKSDKALGRALGEADTTTWLAKKFRATAEYLVKATKDMRYENYPMLSFY